ncbi:MAG: protein kinase [Leptolyngbyaceae bacterium]|nr:protein kinase [Leptolyngbyaceae bacterium]
MALRSYDRSIGAVGTVEKSVVLKFGESSLGQEFPVTLSVAHPDMLPYREVSASLPSDPELYQLYATWATAYRQLGLQSQWEGNDVVERSIIDLETCRNSARLLSDRLNLWLHSESFRPIPAALMEELHSSDDVSMVVQTTNVWLKRLPWHLWDLERAFPGIDLGLMASPAEASSSMRSESPKVRVLFILSHADGIQDPGRSPLMSLPDAEVSVLVAPDVDQFFQVLTLQSWDIIFLSGQKPNQLVGETGRFYLNSSDSLGMDELTPILESTVQDGLQVLGLNSWDGMAIAPVFEAMGIPHVITMREPAPTHAAYQFFESFLTHFADGMPFYRAIRQGRQALDPLDADVPFASWLPIVSQQSTAHAPRWHDWTQSSSDQTLPPLPDLMTDGSIISAQPSGSVPLASQPTDIRTPPELPSMSNRNEDGSTPPSASELSAAQPSRNLIHHRYQIRRVLGRGGFGRTYLAADTHRFDELCVLKQFIPASRSEASLRKARELFQREAKVLYQIDHPQIPKFLAWFTHDEDLFIVQEYVDGQSYLDLMRDRRFQQQKTFSEQEIIQWLMDLVPVLGYIHSIGIVHRDISPANIMFSNAKQKPILIDFGVVKEVVNQILSGQYSTFARPPKATLVGKPGYSPPEQMQLGDCFPCSDFYSLGMTALVLLTGQDARVSRYEWRDEVAVSEGLAHIIERMLAERPKERYQTAQAIMGDLTRLIEQSRPAPAPPAAPMAARGRSHPQQSTARRLLSTPIPGSGESPARSSGTEWDQLQTPELSAQFLAQCEQLLSEYIGPVASFAIEDILSQSSTLDSREFLSMLADEIPDAAASAEFQHQLSRQIQPHRPQPAPGGTPIEGKMSGAIASPGINSTSPHSSRESFNSHLTHEDPNAGYVNTLSPAFIDRCRHELALCIGPMAQFIVDDVLELSSGSSESQFIEAIAAEIPNPKMAETFRQRLR